ncbi:MAG: hypothetical protein ACE5WD_01535 [Candidatus Aminicenantia bacterium]
MEVSLDETMRLVIGSWKWVESAGGIALIKITPETENKSKLIVFQSDQSYLEYINQSLVFKNKFTIRMKKTIFSEELLPVLEIPSRMDQVIYFEDKNTLYLKDNVHDGFDHKFIREK